MLGPPDEPKRAKAQSVDELRSQEPDLLEYLFKAAERTEREVGVVEFPRIQVPQLDDQGKAIRDKDGQPVLGPWSIRVRGLSHEQIEQARKKTRRTWTIDDSGKRVFVPDDAEMASWLVYLGTVPEDRVRWDDKRMWDHFGAASGPDLIDRFLLAGEKNKVAERIRKMSGITLDTDVVEEPSGVDTAR